MLQAVTTPEELNLDAWDTHLSLITNIEGYSKKYKCSKCGELFNRYYNCRRHMNICDGENATKLVFPGAYYKAPKSVFDRLAEFGIETEDRFYPYFAVYDFESILHKVPTEAGSNTTWIAEHQAISVSISSNIPGFTKPLCYVDADLKSLLMKMEQHLSSLQVSAAVLTKLHLGDTYRKAQNLMSEYNKLSMEGRSDKTGEEIEKLPPTTGQTRTSTPCSGLQLRQI